MRYNLFALVSSLLLACPSAHAQSSACEPRVSIVSLKGVLYKPENIHGARGPTFLVQNPMERTGKRRLEIRDLLCRRIGYFGLWSTDWPYGARYYQKARGGSQLSAAQLHVRARRARGPGILVQGVDKWIVVDSPLKRQGSVSAP